MNRRWRLPRIRKGVQGTAEAIPDRECIDRDEPEAMDASGSNPDEEIPVSIELLCKKLGMTRLYTEDGLAVPVTVLEAGPNVVVQKKTDETDGYNAVQLAFGERREALFSKAMKNHYAKNGVASPKRYLSESRLSPDEVAAFEPGAEVRVDMFEAGQKIDAIGTSKGRGFTGVVRRHGFSIKKRTHGTHEFFRHGGSIGAGSNPGRVIPGLNMAGHHGDARTTVQNLEVMKVDAERNLIFVKGAIPGHPNGLVKIRKAAKG
jgi:large subunit ribosomal protein L3